MAPLERSSACELTASSQYLRAVPEIEVSDKQVIESSAS
jgi:hypothetical protein